MLSLFGVTVVVYLNRYRIQKTVFSSRNAEREQKAEYHLLVKELMRHDEKYVFFSMFSDVTYNV